MQYGLHHGGAGCGQGVQEVGGGQGGHDALLHVCVLLVGLSHLVEDVLICLVGRRERTERGRVEGDLAEDDDTDDDDYICWQELF